MRPEDYGVHDRMGWSGDAARPIRQTVRVRRRSDPVASFWRAYYVPLKWLRKWQRRG